NSIPGVLDGAFVIPAEDGREVQRLAVVVVAPGFNREGVMQALRGLLDPAFLPRHLMLVDQLPRNETGKLPREQLLELLRSNGWEGQ
ncbi:MAG: acyl-CoA synthetase, partial [Chromatiaceae bacterium]|nr:acyl-CoA synthetase [Chromatiaceae bacterium]